MDEEEIINNVTSSVDNNNSTSQKFRYCLATIVISLRQFTRLLGTLGCHMTVTEIFPQFFFDFVL